MRLPERRYRVEWQSWSEPDNRTGRPVTKCIFPRFVPVRITSWRDGWRSFGGFGPWDALILIASAACILAAWLTQ